MSAASLIEQVTADHVRRMEAIDPLVATASAPVADRGSLLAVDGGVGVHTVIDTEPDTMVATWSALRRHQLSDIRLSGQDPAAAMRRLLAAWRERLERAPVPAHGESAAVLSWPCRDGEIVNVLRFSGLTPIVTLAVRTDAEPAAPRRPVAGLRVRAVQPRDAGQVTRLHLALAQWDSNFGGARLRPATPDRMREYVEEVIGSARPRGWVAETAGEIVGTCDIEWPDTAGWISPAVAADPAQVAYIDSMSVAPGQRSRGIGSALIARVHGEIEAAGVTRPLLHYAALNPLSAPFWHRAGYRPLLTTWQAQPHSLLRA